MISCRDLPRSLQDLEIFGREGSLYLNNSKVEVRKTRGQAQTVDLTELPAERAEPIAFMIEAIKNKQPIAGMTALDGREFRLYTDLDRLKCHMKELSPADAAPTEEFCKYVQRFAEFNVPVGKPAELMGFLDGMKMMVGFLPFMKLFSELGSLTLESFAARFKDPLLRDGIRNANYGAPGSLFSIAFFTFS